MPWSSHSRSGAILATTWSSPLATAGAASSNDSGGVLRIPYDLTAFGGAKWDPTTPTNPDIWYAQTWIYDTLMRQNADGSYSPGLAKSATATDPQTIVVELKPNIKFSDGTPLDAEAVKFSIERTIAAKNVGSVRGRAQRGREHHRRQPDQVHDQAEDADRGPVLQPARPR